MATEADKKPMTGAERTAKWRANQPPKPPRQLEPCGTPAAYKRHLRQEGSPVTCEECLDAKKRESAEVYAANGRADRRKP